MKNSNGIKILIGILIVLIIVATVLLVLKFQKDKQKNNTNDIVSLGTDEIEIEKEEKKQPQIIKGNDRPIAVMIDNHKGALPQAGLNDAYIVYEMIVEGGETRLMPIFKGKDLEKIGPIRSARHYYLDYALENDAIYVHYGWSPQAQSDIKKLKVQNINGITESETSFWRVKDKYAPHNAVTDTKHILEMAEQKDYRKISTAKSVLNYVVDEVELDTGLEANTIMIPYSMSNTVKYVYNPETKRYTRYSRGDKQTDWVTKEDITTKNIIITLVENTTLNDGEDKGRQTLDNIGTRKGYYITNGKAIEISCVKTSRKEKTVYKDKNGNVISVNDGNTFVQICPIDSELVFE